ncbi:hypothetical protein ANN_28031 [Periplaneta americana]|uniref:DUF2235 domain-containing protein n=1 Tax=Periplaneta americana TaxID=6978 RepID=A0ABQ8RUR3_PERAM|nr:hypothetical protein ANN_28031 [Periplaneta americana]
MQPLPKLSTGEAYYSRQLAFYTLCVTDKALQKPNFFAWNEAQAGRGAIEVASCITTFLSEFNFDSSTKCIRLFADGCGGQNKNMHVVHALGLWLRRKAPQVSEILLVFPVRGRSFLPADRAFGVVEKFCVRRITFLILRSIRRYMKQ